MANTVTEFDTIAAIATPPGEGAISIVRLSGDDAVTLADQVFKGKDLTKVSSHTINYGHFIDPKTRDTSPAPRPPFSHGKAENCEL